MYKYYIKFYRMWIRVSKKMFYKSKKYKKKIKEYFYYVL